MTDANAGNRTQALMERVALIGLVALATGVLVGVLLVPTAVVASDALEFVAGDLLDVGPLPEVETPPQNSYIYATDGSLVAEINFEENREPVTLEEIPQLLLDAVIATEDATFYEHHGINVQSIIRASLQNLRAGDIESGASTITQQYIKIAFLSDRATEQSLDRKIVEAVWAVELEDRISKDEILERYLNRIYFGSGAYGVAAAADRYFSKTLDELELPEAATLAGIINQPNERNPITDPEAALARRDFALNRMVREGFITEQQGRVAMATPLEIDPAEISPPAQPFWRDWVVRLLTNEDVARSLGTQVNALDQMGEDSEERIASVFQGGLRITTTLDPEWQGQAEQAIRDNLTFEDEPLDEIAQEPMGGIVSVEPGTGAIRTMALGPHEYGSCEEDGEYTGVAEDGLLLCHKTKVNPLVPGGGGSGRQPGSSYKPFVIAAALEAGLPPGWQTDSSSGQVIEGCADNYSPSGGGGVIDMYEGVRSSVNVYHAKLTAEIGPRTVADMAGRLGLRNWIRFQESSDPPFRFIGCSLGLGATEVTPLEMATAYATFANRGQYCAPYAIEKIEAPDGTVLYEHTPDCEEAIDESVADRVVDIMRGPVGLNGGGGTAGFIGGALSPHPVRGKTGTTDDSRDAWFVGYVRQLATASWIGYANGTRNYETDEQAAAQCPRFHDGDPETTDYEEGVFRCPPETKLMEGVRIGGDPYARVYGATIPAPMWRDYMVQAVQRFEPEDFPAPGAIPGTTVPDVMEAATLAEAETIAEEAGMTLVTLDEVGYQPPGTAIRQEPEAGATVPLGNAVILYLSDGTGEFPTVPDVVGMTQEEAEQVLRDAGYQPQLFTRPVNDEDNIGIVMAQTPRAGEQVEPGEDVRVAIQIGVQRDDPSDEPSDPASDDDDRGGNGNGNGNGGGGGG